MPNKTITLDYNVLKNLTPARFEFLKIFLNNAEECRNLTQLYEIFESETGLPQPRPRFASPAKDISFLL